MTSSVMKQLEQAQALAGAIRKNDLQGVEELLLSGASANESYEGSDVLSLAASLGYTEIARLLIGEGARVNAHTLSGMTALMKAARRGHVETVSLLLSHGANINAQDGEGLTALMHTVGSTGKLDVMRLLVERGADTSLRNYRAGTVQTLAENWFREDMLQFLSEVAPLREKHAVAVKKQDCLKRLAVRPVIIRGLQP